MREKVTLDFNKDELAVLVQTHPAIVAVLGEPNKGYAVSVVISAQKVVITSEKETTLPGMEPAITKEVSANADADDLPALDEEMSEGEGEDEGTSEPVPLTEEQLDIGSNDNVEATDDGEFEDDDFLGDEQELGLEEEGEEEPDGSSVAFSEY